MTNVATLGSAFAVIARDITFDLNCYTVTYNNSTPIIITNAGFEQGTGTSATGWDMSNAPDAFRSAGEWIKNETFSGDYALRFAVPAPNQYVQSLGTVTLPANTAHSLSFMANKKNLEQFTMYVDLIGLNGAPNRRVSYAGNNNRGIQFVESVFTTGGTSETYTVRVGIEGAEAITTAGNAIVDDVRIQRTKIHGIIAGVYSLSNFTDLTRAGDADRAVVRGGTVKQGLDGATRSHTFVSKGCDDCVLRDMQLTTRGSDSNVINWGGLRGIVYNTDLTSVIPAITSRDQGDGTVGEVLGIVTYNRIHNGPHVGFNLDNKHESLIAHNTIRTQCRYTNCFAIIARGKREGTGTGTVVRNNIIDNADGLYHSRGIMAANTDNPTTMLVHSNRLRIQGLKRIQEYGGGTNAGGMLGGMYAFQAETSDGNIHVYDNDITLFGTEVDVYGIRMTDDAPGNRVYNNTIRAISNGVARAAPMKFGSVSDVGLFFSDNTIETNDGIFGQTNYSDVTIRNLHITAPTLVSNPFVMEAGYVNASLTALHSSIRFLDPLFADSASRATLENALVKKDHKYAANNEDDRLQFSINWTTTIRVRNTSGAPVEGATVTVTNSPLGLVFSGTTDSQGIVTVPLMQQQTRGFVKTMMNPYTISVTKDTSSAQQSVTVTNPSTVIITL
ncbi:MAG: carboxypeptidase-like regulatory domain-containing protein [Candidatus Peribacteraceae bacterium]